MKVYTKCREPKPQSDFSKKSGGRLQSWCKACNREYQKEHYKKNKKNYVFKAKIYKAEHYRLVRRKVLEFLLNHPCACGESHPAALEFDHNDGTDKVAAVAELVSRGCCWETIKAEIDKCTVRCANCHRKRTAEQFGWYTFEQSRTKWSSRLPFKQDVLAGSSPVDCIN